MLGLPSDALFRSPLNKRILVTPSLKTRTQSCYNGVLVYKNPLMTVGIQTRHTPNTFWVLKF